MIKHTLNKIMVLKANAHAVHLLGELYRGENEEIIRVYAEDHENYIGCFEEGLGFIDVKFKKCDCRKLNLTEISELNKKYYAINGRAFYKFNLDSEGNLTY